MGKSTRKGVKQKVNKLSEDQTDHSHVILEYQVNTRSATRENPEKLIMESVDKGSMSKKKETKVDTPLTKRKKETAVKAWFSEDDDFVTV